MSAVTITHQFTCGSAVEITIEVEDSFPQALAEAEARCLSLYRSVVVDPEPSA